MTLGTFLGALLTRAAEAAGVFSAGFALLSAAAGYAFLRRRRLAAARELPPVTILKPLKGLEPGLYESLETFCRLDYPRFQLLFTLASPEDPSLPVLSRLRQAHPELDIEIIVSKHRIGFNPKINNVSNAAPFIKHDVLLFCDSDIRVRPDFLRRMVAPLNDARVGLVTCFYKSASRGSLWSRLEALAVNVQFAPQAVVAAAFGMRFAMGAAMLVRREAFESSGGFANMAQHLADDFILGESVREAGWSLELADCMVESVPDVTGPVAHLRHQARWARTIRLCNPGGFAGSVVLHGFSLLSLKLLLVGWDPFAAKLAALVLAAQAASYLALASATERRPSVLDLALLPVSDWIAFGSWLAGFRSSRVLWRGEEYAVEAHGRLVPIGRGELHAPAPVAVEP